MTGAACSSPEGSKAVKSMAGCLVVGGFMGGSGGLWVWDVNRAGDDGCWW